MSDRKLLDRLAIDIGHEIGASRQARSGEARPVGRTRRQHDAVAIAADEHLVHGLKKLNTIGNMMVCDRLFQRTRAVGLGLGLRFAAMRHRLRHMITDREPR